MAVVPGTLESIMTEKDLKRVEELFHAAADLDPELRDAFLSERCQGDLELRQHVERLLARLDQDVSLVSPTALAGPFPTAAVTEGPGVIIGRYKLLQIVGEGGFGVVYVAEQQEPVVRKVALKIIKLGMDTREVVARFEAERQALAMMDHTNIARVFDGGTTDSGRPYFVMELVRGVSITEYCDRNQLRTEERLELFLDVCSAVQHAHQKGVVHRDLKPSNVLVTLHDGRPVPKVIDFGVAKALHARLTDKTLFTRYEQFIGTPTYMSPEQAEMSGLDVDTRTDVYSLGVLMYELLTGTTPFGSDTPTPVGVLEIQRMIKEDHPQLPSMRISTHGDAAIAQKRGLDPSTWCKRVRGDLDWIVMRALEKDRRRRYGTVSELGDDIRRHLGREPVLAGPPSAVYRTKKFLSRNRTAVFSGGLVLFALVLGMIGTTLGKIQADQSAKLAQVKADHALDAVDFLLSTLALTDPKVSLDPDVTVRTLLDHMSPRVKPAFEDQPWTEARVRWTIGRAYESLGESALAEPHLRRAVQIVDRESELHGLESPDFGTPGYGAGEFYSTMWTLTNVCFNLERNDSFAVGERAQQVGLTYLSLQYPELSRLLGSMYDRVKDDAWSKEDGAMSDVPARFAQACSEADRCLPQGDPRWPVVANLVLACGYLVWYTPHEPMSEEFFARALEIQRRELPADHPEIATTVRLLVGILNKFDKSVEAEELIRESIEALRRVHQEGSLPVAVAESALGETLVVQGRFQEAEPILLASHDVILSAAKNPENFNVVESTVKLLALYNSWGREEKASFYRNELARAYAVAKTTMTWTVLRPTFGASQREILEVLERIEDQCGGISYRVTPGTARAPELHLELDAVERHYQSQDEGLLEDTQWAGIARLLVGWANSLVPEGQHELRHRMARLALGILESSSIELPVVRAEALGLCAETWEAHGNRDQARMEALQSLRLIEEFGPGGLWFLAAGKVRLARGLVEHGFLAHAESVIAPSLQIMIDQIGEEHPDTVATRAELDRIQTAQGRTKRSLPVGSEPKISPGATSVPPSEDP